MLQQVGTSDNFRYEYRAAPVGVDNATFVQEGSAEDKETQPASGHKHDYTDATAGASMPQDLIVTEWKVTGHVHFAASQ
jgi:hypothetical protein